MRKHAETAENGLRSYMILIPVFVLCFFDSSEDSSAYTDSVVSLFQSSYILEDMLKHYNALSPFQTHIQIINRLRRLSEFLYFVVCAFVVRDLSELMSRYLKRVGTWVNE